MPPKKKLSKKEKARLEAEQAELLRIEMEKEKLKKLEEARQRRKVEKEQANRRLQIEIQQNKLRRFQLKNSMAFFDQIQESSKAIAAAAKEESEWAKFMRCNGLPNSNSPSDLRRYIHQWKIDLERRNRESRNWLLKTNERTVLTQDTCIPDLSKATLRKQQESLGDVYAQRVKEVLGILCELEEVLADKHQSPHTLVDLGKLKTEIRVLLKDYLDDFTYKIMSHIERDMENENERILKSLFENNFCLIRIDRPGVSKHIYDSEVFKSFIWTFSKDAQISLSPKPRIGNQNVHNEIEFPLIEMHISLPPSVTLYSSALRGLWMNYDHFSDYCSSFRLQVPPPANANILKQSKMEWRKRKEILENMLQEFSKEIPATDLEQFEHERDLISQQKSIDVDKMYLEYEDELSNSRKKAIGPAGFDLLATDVNLRKYRIIGGVYCTDYLEAPQQDKQLNPRSFIRTICTPNKLAHKNYYQTFKPPPPPQPGVRRLPEEIEAEMRMVEAALDQLALVTVQLPASVIWFEPPIACRWETPNETLQSDLAEINTNVVNKADNCAPEASRPPTITDISHLKGVSPHFPATKYSKISSRKIPTSNPDREIIDFDMLKMPCSTDICSVIENFIVPRLPLGFSVRINGQRLKQLQRQKRKTGKNWNKPTKLVFLARLQTTIPDEAAATCIQLKDSKALLSEVSLDLDEPREFFPCTQIDRVLKIHPAHEDKEFKLDLRKQRSLEEDEHLVNSKSTSPQYSRSSANSEAIFKTSLEHENVSGPSFSESGEYKADKRYMFSQFIKDLDRLRDLQMPKLQAELYEQISANLRGCHSSNTKEICSDATAVQTTARSTKTETQMLISVPQQPGHVGVMSGISVSREAETLKSGCNEERQDAEEDDCHGTSTDESEDIEEYDQFFCNEYLNNNSAVALTSNQSEVSDGTAAATLSESPRKQGSSHDCLNKRNACDTTNFSGNGKRSQMQNEAILPEGKWSTRDVHDTKFNEDKLSIQFRTGRLGIFGFALNRYSNMPYQTWEIKPDMKNPGNILFSFTASLISLDVTISSQGFCVNNFQGGSTSSINEMIGKTLPLEAIKQTLISSAVDIFPEEDAFCYTEGSCEKNYVMEMHLYACMSTLSLSHNFSWSRWNLLAGSRTAVLLSRELVGGKKVPSHSTLLVTPLKTSIIDCTEVSASFNSQGIAGMEYYADLYQLAQVHAQPSSLEKQRSINPLLRDNVAAILMAIRPLSFC